MRTPGRTVVIVTVVALAVGVFASAPLSADTAATPSSQAILNRVSLGAITTLATSPIDSLPTNDRPPIVGFGDGRATAGGHGLCSSGACFYYASMVQYGVMASGMSASFTQAQPKVGAKDVHSLTELAVESLDQRQIIEVGWIVSKSLTHDSLSHLFVYHWMNGSGTCFNACGFVPVSKKFTAGQVVAVGQVGSYGVQLKKSQWQVEYDGVELGYFPASLWKGKFTQVGVTQVFGEVESTSATTPHSQMGNGILGSLPKAAEIRNTRLIGSTALAPLYSYTADQAPTKYQVGGFKPTCQTSCGMSFGGPGY